MVQRLTALAAATALLLFACNDQRSADQQMAASDVNTLYRTESDPASTPRPSDLHKIKSEQEQQIRNRTGDSVAALNTEDYDPIIENTFLSAVDDPLSTFSIDVDRAAYSNVRRFLTNGMLPPPGAVRIEEMINYFDYDYPQPSNGDPFCINTEIAPCPWNPRHQLIHIGLQGKTIPLENLPPSNLVFLIDVSGSMDEPNKLPLVQASLKLLTRQLRPQDKVAIVVYAGSAGLVLPSINGDHKAKINEAINELEAGGSTAGGAGIDLAY